MEKIIVLTSDKRDDNLVNCLKMLFPECVVEVHEKNSEVKREEFFPGYGAISAANGRAS